MPKIVFSRILLAAALGFSIAAHAQNYPDKPIKIIVPFPPGGATDIVARIVAEKLRGRWDQAVIVENRAGAAGNIGTEAVFRAAPDGYTLLYTPLGPLVIHKSLYAKLSYDPDAFVPVSESVESTTVLVVHPKVAAESVQQLIALAKGNPDRLNYASPGSGTSFHLLAESFNSMAGVRIVHVPYKGTGPAITDLLSGQVDMMFTEISTTLPHIRAGKMRLLAVTSEKRNSLLPGTPTVSEVLPKFVGVGWHGIVAPPGTPSAIATKLSTAIAEALKQPDVAQRLLELNLEAVGSAPAEMALFMMQERERWGNVIRALGLKIE